MSVYLSNNNGDHLMLSNLAWAQMLSLAKLYGWEPAGTVASWRNDEVGATQWDGNYCSHDGQTVTAEDALTIANSLKTALLATTEPLVRGSGHIPIDESFHVVVAMKEAVKSALGPSYQPYSEIFPNRIGEQDVRDFIQFAGKGEFCIF